jgi:hydroxyacylglutathione hydrolase
MNLQQFPYSSDNFSYVLYGEKSALAIDGGAVDDILDFVEKNNLKLTQVTHTHLHPDHTCGTEELLSRSGAALLEGVFLSAHAKIELDGMIVRVHATPGHTDDSVTFHVGNCLITGDTLFNGTIGNCFSGDIQAFYNSIKFLMAFPADTVIYAGHDYLKYAMSFSRIIEPDNPDIDPYLKAYNPAHVWSRLSDELKVNPYLRFNDSRFIEVLKKKNLPVSTEFQRWESVMGLG